jgi:hypothetical protein
LSTDQGWRATNFVASILSLRSWPELLNKRGFQAAAETHGMVRETVSFLIAMARDVSDSKLQGPRQLAAGPVERIKPRTSADIFSSHLLYHQLRIGKYVERGGFHLRGILQGLSQCHVFGYVVVLVADPFSDLNGLAVRLLNHNPNT